MANDQAISNGQNSILTPSKLNTKQNETKSFIIKSKFDDTDSEREQIDFLYQQLTTEQKNNKYLKKELSEMRIQLSELTKTINNLNDIIIKLQSHNKDLLKSKRKDIKNITYKYSISKQQYRIESFIRTKQSTNYTITHFKVTDNNHGNTS